MISWVATPVPQTEILAVRELVVVLGAQVTVIVLLLLPVLIFTLAQDAEEETFQVVFERILNVFTPPPETKLIALVDRVRKRELADCDTVTVWALTPDPEIVIVPDRTELLVFVEAVTTTVPLLVPFVALSESQSRDSESIQLVLDEIARFWEAPVALKDIETGDTVRKVLEAAWKTVTICESAPVPEKVIVPDRWTLVGLGSQVTVMEPLLVPPDPLRESQVRDSETVQAVLEVTVIVWLPLASPNESTAGETVRIEDAACWVIETVRLVTPAAENVRVADLAKVEVLGAAVAEIEPLLVPETADRLSHSGLPETVQEVLEETLIVCVPPAAM
jgi:hypothetical protein